MKKYIEQNGITYELRGEQYYPLLELPEQKEIGKYGRMHLDYLKEHRKGRYTNLLSEGTCTVPSLSSMMVAASNVVLSTVPAHSPYVARLIPTTGNRKL